MRWSISLPGPDGRADLGTVGALLEAAQTLEQLGFDAGWVSDHPFPKLVGGNEHRAYDPFSALAHVAATTERLLLHTNVVVVPFRNPFLLANQAVTVDHLSGGRLILGLGTGYLRPEFGALGADFEQRGRLTREAIPAMKAAFTGEPVTLVGDGWQADGNTLRPLAPRRGHPILWRGGNSRPAIQQAAREFDGWCPAEAPAPVAARSGTHAMASLDELATRIRLFRQLAADAGRSEHLDVALTRPEPEWRRRPPADVREELAALAELGVDWIAVWLKETTSLADYLATVHALAELRS
jgi:probable F420-dependent oxidoreductase